MAKDFLQPVMTSFFPTPDCQNCPLGMEAGSCHVECLSGFESEYTRREGEVASFLIEPFMVEAGMLRLSAKYLKRLRNLCSEFGVYLLYDEVQTSGGWLSDYAIAVSAQQDHAPDAVTLGKAISNGFPLSAVALVEDLDVIEYGEHEFTHGGSLVSLAAFNACIRTIRSEAFLQIKRSSSNAIEKQAKRLTEFSCVAQLRGEGLLWSIALGAHLKLDRRQLQALLLKHRVIARTTSDNLGRTCIQLKISPYLDEYAIDFAFQQISNCLLQIQK